MLNDIVLKVVDNFPILKLFVFSSICLTSLDPSISARRLLNNGEPYRTVRSLFALGTTKYECHIHKSCDATASSIRIWQSINVINIVIVSILIILVNNSRND